MRVKNVYIHDTVFVKPDTVVKSDTVIYYRGLINSRRIHAETDYASAWSQVVNSRIRLQLIQNDTAVARLLKKKIQIKEVYKTRTKVIKEWRVHWYHTAALWVAIPVILLIVAYILMKLLKYFI